MFIVNSKQGDQTAHAQENPDSDGYQQSICKCKIKGRGCPWSSCGLLLPLGVGFGICKTTQ